MRLLIVFACLAVGVRTSYYIDLVVKTLKASLKGDSDRRFLSLANDDSQHSNICLRGFKLPFKLEAQGNQKSVDFTLFQLLKAVYIQGLTGTNPRREDVEGTFLGIIKRIQGPEARAGKPKPKPSSGQQLGFLDSLCDLDVAGLTKELFGGMMKLFGEVNAQMVDSLIDFVKKTKTERTNIEMCESMYYDQLIAELQAFQSKASDLEKSAEDFLKTTSKALVLLKILYLNIADRYLKNKKADQLEYRFLLLYDSLYMSKQLFANSLKSKFERPRARFHKGLTLEYAYKNLSKKLEAVEYKLETLMSETLGTSFADPPADGQDARQSKVIKGLLLGLGFNENSYII